MPKVIDHFEMRNRILEKSHRIFSETGYQSVSMRLLAQKIGVTTGVLYHYFKNKEELVRAVLLKGLEQPVSSKLTDQTFRQLPRDLPIQDRLRLLFDSIAESDDAPITNIMLLNDYFRELKESGQLESNYQFASQFLEAFRLSIGIEKRNTDLARFILIYLIGVHTVRLWTGKRMKLQKFGDIFIKFAKL